MNLGIPKDTLRDKHGPCPLCGGSDRFRWDNKEGKGGYICSQCGAGAGIDLAMKFTGKQFGDVCREIDSILGNNKIDVDQIKPDMDEARIKAALRELAGMTTRVKKGDKVDRYLYTRGVDRMSYPPALRFAKEIRDGEGGLRPAMIATVQASCGQNLTLHRTFLNQDGTGKAEMSSPRKIMPGKILPGAAIRLSEYTEGPLGIAEGIETALSACDLFDMPVWASINSTGLSQWIPPEGCTEVVIFGDNDPKFGGHAAAWGLAHKLAVKGLEVSVKIPPMVGQDWNDVLSGDTQRDST